MSGHCSHQSSGMGEGWSDYFALTILNLMRNQDKFVVGEWVTNSSRGIRLSPYDENYPGHLGRLGKLSPRPRPHRTPMKGKYTTSARFGARH